ncbi:MAG: hypothetical protein WKG07_23850 [Hymenobacter sp.]
MVEMVVLLGIMGVLSGLVRSQRQSRRQAPAVRDAASQFVSAAKRAESMAAASEVVEDPTASALPIRLKKHRAKPTESGLSSSATTACQRTGSSLPNYQLYVRNTSGTSDLAATTGAILVKITRCRLMCGFLPLRQTIYNGSITSSQPGMTANGKNVPVSAFN